MRNILIVRVFSVFLFFALTSNTGYAQVFFGLKAGINATKAKYENEVYKKFYDSKYKPGFTAGAVFLIENKGKYGLYTEFLYTVKGKRVDSHANDYVSNQASYNYLDVPVLFRMKFEQPKFNWFLQIGPEISYWLGGKGEFRVYEPDRDVISTYKYEINFGEREGSSDYLNVPGRSHRLQMGLAIGGGFIWDVRNGNYISLDLRYTFGHSYMGDFESASIPNIGLVENFKHTNNVASVSAVYYFDILEKNRLSKNKYRKK